MKLSKIATNIVKSENGIWKTLSREKIFYTKNGHALIKENEKKSFWFVHRHKCLTQILNNYPVNIVLDIGGGNGQFSRYLQSINIETALLEPGIEGAKNAFQNGVKNVINGSLLESGFIDSCFPAVTLFDVLEHIQDDDKFLEEINRILKPEGKLFLTVPAFQFLYSSFDREAGHFRRYTIDELKSKLEKKGFQINYKTYFFSLLPIPIILTRFFYDMFKKREKRRSTGHVKGASFLGFILGVLLSPELFLIKREFRIPFGSSCLIVAQKLKNCG